MRLTARIRLGPEHYLWFAAWNAEVQRARLEYALHPTVSRDVEHRAHPDNACQGCGGYTRNKSRLCKDCRPGLPPADPTR